MVLVGNGWVHASCLEVLCGEVAYDVVHGGVGHQMVDGFRVIPCGGVVLGASCHDDDHVAKIDDDLLGGKQTE